MPITPSHAVAILPFIKTPLPTAALVIGSMAPDLQYFVPLALSRSASHSWPGILYIDIPIGVVALLLWVFVLRAPVLDYSPRWLRERMGPAQRARNRWVYAGLVVVALEVGILTHLLLDLPTHAGWLSEQWSWMRGSVGPFSVLRILHFSASVIGAVIIAIWARGWVRRTPRHEVATLVKHGERRVVWIVIPAVLTVVCLALVVVFISEGQGLLDGSMWFVAFCAGVGVAGALAVALSVIWHVRKTRY